MIPNHENDFVVALDSHPAIIDKETYDKCRAVQRQRGKTHYTAAHRSGRSKTSPYLLSGLIKCSNCGFSYQGIPTKKGKPRTDGSPVRTYYYICGGYRSRGTSVCRGATIPREPIEDAVLASIRSSTAEFMDDGGEELLRSIIKKCLEPGEVRSDEVRRCEERANEINARIEELVESLTPINKEFVDRKLEALKEERDELVAREENFKRYAAAAVDTRALAEEIVESIRQFDEVFAEGTRQEQKEFVNLFIERIDVDAEKSKATVRIRKFPAPQTLGAGNNLLVLVAGAGFEPATFGL
ncbi:MAG: recombinase zinc beta ribbon domain-containing protein [Candidatus Krumholzibacteriota bacterium]|nr:recombinase zinc beta ribbon domain-containing protein [Candidatus Krumholzibacteriota bacterium]